MGNTKIITTSIPLEVWKHAEHNGFPETHHWSEALELGITMMIGRMNDEAEIRQEIKKHDSQKRYFEKKLEEIHEIRTKKDEILKKIRANLKIFAKSADIVLENPHTLKFRTDIVNRELGIELDQDDFFKLAKRYKEGEFNGKDRKNTESK